MNRLFKNFEFISIYSDDILIFSKPERDHVLHLKSFYDISASNNISLNFIK